MQNLINDGCHNCRYRLNAVLLDYRGRGCKHKDMKGFICTAFASEGVAHWMVGLDDDDSKCEVWERREKNNAAD